MNPTRALKGLRWFLLPFSLLHELLHVAAARPWVTGWEVSFGVVTRHSEYEKNTLIERANRLDHAAQNVDRECYSYFRDEAFRLRKIARGSGREYPVTASVDYRDDAPPWGIALSHLAPLLCGAVVMLALGTALLLDAFPALPPRLNALVWAALLASIVLLSKPSQADKDIGDALAAIDGGDDDGD